MQGNLQAKQALNQALRSQLIAINQYFLHARMCKNWKLEKLNKYAYQRSIKAMKQADELMERILFLEGLPNLKGLGKLYIGEDVPEIIANDLRLTTEIGQELRSIAAACEQAQDYVSRDLIEKLLEEGEEQIDWLEKQQWQLQQLGIQNYLQSMIEQD